MPSNLAIDDALLAQALKLGRHATKRETVEEALREYVARRQRVEAIAQFGTIEFKPGWSYKRERRKR